MKNIKDYAPSGPVSFRATPALLISRLSYLSGLYVDKNCSEEIQKRVILDRLVTSQFNISTEISFACLREKYAMSAIDYVEIVATSYYGDAKNTDELDKTIKIDVKEFKYEKLDKQV